MAGNRREIGSHTEVHPTLLQFAGPSFQHVAQNVSRVDCFDGSLSGTHPRNVQYIFDAFNQRLPVLVQQPQETGPALVQPRAVLFQQQQGEPLHSFPGCLHVMR